MVQMVQKKDPGNDTQCDTSDTTLAAGTATDYGGTGMMSLSGVLLNFLLKNEHAFRSYTRKQQHENGTKPFSN